MGDRIENALTHAAGSFVEIARILFQERRKYRASDERTDDQDSVRRAVALTVALCALDVSAGSVGSLLGSCDDSSDCKIDWINGAAPGELKFLFGAQRSGIRNVADIEIGNDAEDALLFFDLELFFGDFDARDVHLNLGELCSESEDDLRENEKFARMQYRCDLLRGEEFRYDADLKRPRRNAHKGELTFLTGEDFLFGGLIVTRENYVCSGDSRSGRINDGTADTARRLRVGWLIRSLAGLLVRLLEGRRGGRAAWC